MESVGLKQRVKDRWEQEVCGSRYAPKTGTQEYFDTLDEHRYRQDYMLRDFARFPEATGKTVLEVGLGTGADFIRWVQSGAKAYGRDLTQASVDMVRQRLALAGLKADVGTGDAERLEFPNDFFDIYYSWGCLHHTPDTATAFEEAYRLLRPGGALKVMIYHYPSVSAALIWLLYGPLRLNLESPRTCYARHVESPGTKLYTMEEARALVRRFSEVRMRTYLASADLLGHEFSMKYQGAKWRVVKKVYPRWFVRHVLGHRFGTYLVIEATKR